jgi:hypothetical protein
LQRRRFWDPASSSPDLAFLGRFHDDVRVREDELLDLESLEAAQQAARAFNGQRAVQRTRFS